MRDTMNLNVMQPPYVCDDCECVFYTPKVYTETEEAYGRPIKISFYGCPYCAGASYREKDPDEWDEDDEGECS